MIKLLLSVTLLVLCTGCSTGYWLDRRADAADVFTVTVGTGGGLSARVGPVGVGMLVFRDRAGLRGGTLKPFSTKNRSAWFIGPIEEQFLCSQARKRDKAYVSKIWFLLDNEDRDPSHQSRSSGSLSCDFSGIERIDAEGLAVVAAVIVAVCSVSLPVDVDHYPDKAMYWCHWPYFTDVQGTVAIGAGVRLGFNPGELVDWLLGFVGRDIYGDDLSCRDRVVL